MEFGDRSFRYKANLDDWRYVDVETLYYKNLGSLARSLLQPAQFSPSIIGKFLNSEGEIDIKRLETDQNFLKDFLLSGGNLLQLSSGIFDIPVNDKIGYAVTNGNYGKYSDLDFYSVELGLQSELRYEEKEVKLSTAFFAHYNSDRDRRLAAASLKEYPIYLRIISNEDLKTVYEIPESGFLLGAEDNKQLPISYYDNVEQFKSEKIKVSIQDKYGNSFGSFEAGILSP